ncbi:MAG: asparagine synthase (glutamine-hydrolyzing) [Phycisphaerales bacterium]|nr:asparagine synthase (glutamine-hydrolyzing) [Phycisphaerales bacterium]
MCGITGYWEPNRQLDNAEKILGDMMDTIHHRGPDGRGRFLDNDEGLAMGHTRLSIIDLEGGEQPIHSPNHRRILTVNGEFYDYKQIRANLVFKGHRFSTKSDSEIALPLYEEHGLSFVDHLRGEFAFAIFDRDEKAMILVRDRFGIKPLYYRVTDEGFYYGSEVKSLLAHPRVPAELDPKATLHQMMQVMVPGTTSFKGVKALLPGHMLVVKHEGDRLTAREVRYWDLEFPEASDHDMDAKPEPYIEAVRANLIDAVRTRLEADVPVGCYLSGGIDSCSILGMATPMQQSPVKAFTIAFDHTDYDESSIAREMAEMTGADQEVLELSAHTLYGDHFAKVAWHAERTFYNTLSVAKWHMSKRVRECGFKVVITGEGSDELFGGYPFFKRDFFLHSTEGGAQLAREVEDANAVFRGAILSEEQRSHPAWEELCGFTPSWIQPWMMTLDAVRPLLSDDLAAELEGYDPLAAIAETIRPEMVKGRHPLDIAQYTWSKTMLEGQILTWGGDRVDMANSMESRPAFLDHHVAEHAVTIPPNIRIKGGIEKWVLREAMKPVLPETLYKREKFAFMAPPSRTDESKLSAAMALVGRWMPEERVTEAGLFDAERVKKFLAGDDDNPEIQRRGDIILNHLLGVHILYATLVKGEQIVEGETAGAR